MTFGNNSLDLVYAPDQASTPLELRFTSLAALSNVATGEGWEDRVGGGVQVAMAEHWSQNRYVIVHTKHFTTYLAKFIQSARYQLPLRYSYL
jgi:hypothetical protein